MTAYELFIKPYEEYETYQIVLEAIATLFGLLSVYFSIQKKIWVYPTGIISTIIYVYLLFGAGLWGDMMINFYYSVMSIYGWFLWSNNSKDKVNVEVSYTQPKEWFICCILFVFSIIFVSLVYYYKPLINNPLPNQQVVLGLEHLDWANWLDIATTAIFLVGMWLMAKRKIENWIFWILGDFISVPMYLYKGLGITSVQFLIFTILAILGYLNWRKIKKFNIKN